MSYRKAILARLGREIYKNYPLVSMEKNHKPPRLVVRWSQTSTGWLWCACEPLTGFVALLLSDLVRRRTFNPKPGATPCQKGAGTIPGRPDAVFGPSATPPARIFAYKILGSVDAGISLGTKKL